MTTDTIPEVAELCAMLDSETNGQVIAARAAELMEAYFQRRLSECGDAQETTEKIYGKYKVGITTGQFACAMADARELLQLHTARAVEEATAEYLRASPAIAERDYQLAAIQKQCESLQQKLTIYEGQTQFYCECGGVRQKERLDAGSWRLVAEARKKGSVLI